MRVSLLVSLFTVFLVNCTSPSIVRTPSSSLEIDFNQSNLRILSVKTVDQEEAYFFYLEARNSLGIQVDFNANALIFKSDNQLIPADHFQESKGRYYYRIFFKNIPSKASRLSTFIEGKPFSDIELKHQEKLASLDIARSKMRITRFENHSYFFELELLDSQNRVVQTTEKPEIYVEGNAVLLGISSPGSGKWEGELQILDTNSIIYLSVRLNSNHLPRLLRIQHIEK